MKTSDYIEAYIEFLGYNVEEVQNKVITEFKNHYSVERIKDGGVILTPREGKTNVGLVAHCDTVNGLRLGVEGVEKAFIEIDGYVLRLTAEGREKYACLGGDDRSGVYYIVQIIRKLIAHGKQLPCIILSEFEEGGVNGARRIVDASIKSDNILKNKGLQYLLELDRKEFRNYCFYDLVVSADFRKLITENYGYLDRGQRGRTDIVVFCPYLNIDGVNLSVGYFNAHTKDEYINTEHDAENQARIVALVTELHGQFFTKREEKV